ncbi:MAG: M48 family metallopeptidase [Clostridia bacterium]|nr:M48 family metallopeptidase [Clostridia bacterium]
MVQPDEIIRTRRKTLAIAVDSFGRLIVRAPMDCSEARIFAFLQEKENWILRKQAERKGAGIDLPPENLNGYSLFLLGKKCKIYVIPTSKVGYNSEKDVIYLPENNPKERLIKWLKNNAKRIFTSVTAQTAARMDASYKSVTVTSARGRWGSCSGDNALHYSFRLIYAPKDVIEYVAVHELAHTKHKNHSKAFWTEVEKYVPDWKIKRKWLKLHGGLMEIF